jgi:ketosteroid isomerase-like protein
MATVDDLDQLLERWHLAQDEFVKRNPDPVKKMWSHAEDVIVANPYGPPLRGWDKVTEVVEHAASLRRDGEATGFEVVAKYTTAELAYVVQIERAQAKVGTREDTAQTALRATMIFRPEDGKWKIVHRHADSIATPQPAESVIREKTYPQSELLSWTLAISGRKG